MEPLVAAEIVLIEGTRGIFDIRVDGELVYSKFTTGRFPSDRAVDALGRALAARLAARGDASRDPRAG